MSRSPRDRLVTVDGPAGSGKSTLGHRLGAILDLPVIDTGLFYRGLTVAAVRVGVDGSDSAAVIDLVRHTQLQLNTAADPAAGGWSLRVDGEVADQAARDPRTATLLSWLSGIPEVRALLLDRQRALAVGGAVAVGRDCGTVVFPAAPVKLYLQASGVVRAERRAAQLRARGTEVDPSTLMGEIAGRDRLDSTRSAAPLRAAADAHVVDTGRHGIEEMVSEALHICRMAGLGPPASQR